MEKHFSSESEEEKEENQIWKIFVGVSEKVADIFGCDVEQLVCCCCMQDEFA